MHFDKSNSLNKILRPHPHHELTHQILIVAGHFVQCPRQYSRDMMYWELSCVIALFCFKNSFQRLVFQFLQPDVSKVTLILIIYPCYNHKFTTCKVAWLQICCTDELVKSILNYHHPHKINKSIKIISVGQVKWKSLL